MLEVKIYKDYYITSDTYNYVLSRKLKNKKGVERYKHLAYHGTISGVLESFKQDYVRNQDIKSIKELVSILNEVNKAILDIREQLGELEYFVDNNKD